MVLPDVLILLTTLYVISLLAAILYETTSPTLKSGTQPVVPLVTAPPFVIVNDLPPKSFLVSNTTSAAKVLLAAVDLTDFTSERSNSVTDVIILPS